LGTRENIYTILSGKLTRGNLHPDVRQRHRRADRQLRPGPDRTEGRIIKEIAGEDITEENLLVSSLNVERSGEKPS
jgi:hypothetical protein